MPLRTNFYEREMAGMQLGRRLLEVRAGQVVVQQGCVSDVAVWPL